MKFQDYRIAPEIKKSLEKLGYKRPTDIQFKSIPAILKGEDVLAIAQTGTGKTAAFAIPIIDRISRQKKSIHHKQVKCLVMVPTHELAIQISEAFKAISKHSKVTTFALYGGVQQDPQIEELKKGVDILVATPGRMFDFVSQGHLKLDRVQTLVLDEADHMLDLGFIKDIRDLIKHLPRTRQTLFFSATINDVIKKLAYSLVNNPIRIQLSPKDPVAKNITHSVIHIEMDDKRFFLERIINENDGSKILVFVRTKVRAERVKKAMERVDIMSNTIHSSKNQDERVDAMKEFKTGTTPILIATDVSARGIDIPNVEYVVNYDLPEQSENYVHRVGRTGRGTHKGLAITFCSPEEKPILEEIEGFLGKAINVMDLAKDDYLDTLDFTKDHDDNWRELLKSSEGNIIKKKRKKK